MNIYIIIASCVTFYATIGLLVFGYRAALDGRGEKIAATDAKYHGLGYYRNEENFYLVAFFWPLVLLGRGPLALVKFGYRQGLKASSRHKIRAEEESKLLIAKQELDRELADEDRNLYIEGH
jgi:hypothetical protein